MFQTRLVVLLVLLAVCTKSAAARKKATMVVIAKTATVFAPPTHQERHSGTPARYDDDDGLAGASVSPTVGNNNTYETRDLAPHKAAFLKGKKFPLPDYPLGLTISFNAHVKAIGRAIVKRSNVFTATRNSHVSSSVYKFSTLGGGTEFVEQLLPTKALCIENYPNQNAVRVVLIKCIIEGPFFIAEFERCSFIFASKVEENGIGVMGKSIAPPQRTQTNFYTEGALIECAPAELPGANEFSAFGAGKLVVNPNNPVPKGSIRG